MEPIILTPRLKLTLITTAERGSQDLNWYHELRTDEKATFWSIYGPSKTIEDTEEALKAALPTKESPYKVTYAVHKLLDSNQSTEFIGFLNLKSVSTEGDAQRSLALPEHLTLPAAAATTTLTIEIGYAFLPKAWGQGYATESVKAAFEACRATRAFWAPYSKLYVRAIVIDLNPASLKVMDKTGIPKTGIYEWTGEAIFHGGEWRDHTSLHIYGGYLFE